jgi:hypothetical protein
VRKLKFYNNFHYGDCLTSLHFLDHLTKVNEVECVFQCYEGYQFQLRQFIEHNPRITVESIPNGDYCKHDLRIRGHDRAINLWVCPSISRMWGMTPESLPKSVYADNFPQMFDVGKLLLEIWKFICDKYMLVCPFQTKDDIIFDQPCFMGETHGNGYDFLLVNSVCQSGQMKISQEEQDHIMEHIAKGCEEFGFSYITTRNIGNRPCTQDYNMTLMNIGQLSKNCNVILGVPTAPFWMAVNKWTIERSIKIVNWTNDFTAFDFKNKTNNIYDVGKLMEEISKLMGEIHARRRPN